jgi:predicted double-glycine peptidase
VTRRSGLRLRFVAAALSAGLLAACNASSPIDPVASLRELRDLNVVKQRYDFSCGAASLATLVNGFFGDHRSEVELLKTLQARYTPEAWNRKRAAGLSLDDLAYMADKIGYRAEGAEIGLAGLLQINGPAIVHLRKGKLEHFSVFRGTRDGAILLADPISGNTVYSPGQFAAQYTGVALAVWREGSPLPKEYPLAATLRDARSQLKHAAELSRLRREPLPTEF